MKKISLLALILLSIPIYTRAQFINAFAGCDSAGFSGDGGPAIIAALASPLGMAVDANGNVYFSDAGNSRIRKVNTAGIISTVAGNGVQGYKGDGGPADSAELNTPQGIAIDDTGNIYIADQANNRIRKINTLGIITTIAGNGTQGFSGDSGLATLAKLNRPISIAAGNNGNIYS